jgi:hypothetical protein
LVWIFLNARLNFSQQFSITLIQSFLKTITILKIITLCYSCIFNYFDLTYLSQKLQQSVARPAANMFVQCCSYYDVSEFMSKCKYLFVIYGINIVTSHITIWDGKIVQRCRRIIEYHNTYKVAIRISYKVYNVLSTAKK